MKIETKDWSWECGDGCCYNWGTTLFIDGKPVEDRDFTSESDAYLYVLQTVLGHEVDVIYDEME